MHIIQGASMATPTRATKFMIVEGLLAIISLLQSDITRIVCETLINKAGIERNGERAAK